MKRGGGCVAPFLFGEEGAWFDFAHGLSTEQETFPFLSSFPFQFPFRFPFQFSIFHFQFSILNSQFSIFLLGWWMDFSIFAENLFSWKTPCSLMIPV